MADFLIPSAGLAVNAAAQMLSVRLKLSSLLKSIYIGFTAGLATVLTAALACTTADTVYCMSVYVCLGYCYFHFVNLGETARRIRLVREIAEKPAGISEQEILGRYNAASIVNARLGRLIRNRQVAEIGGFLKIGRPAVLAMSKAISGLKKLLLGPHTGQ